MKIVHVAIRNRSVFLGCGQQTEKVLSEFWSFAVKGARWVGSHKLWLRHRERAEKAGRPIDNLPGWDGRIRYLRNGAVPEGLWRATRMEIKEKLGIRFRVVSCDNPAGKLCVRPVERQADERYHYQEDCIETMQAGLRTGGGLVLIATGGGKTALTGRFMQSVRNVNCLFVVDTIDLLYQAQKELAHWTKEKIGVVGDSVWTPERITVATRQTLNANFVLHKDRFKRWLNRIDVVVVDELHEQMSKRNFKILEAMHPIARYGLTATLQMKKKEVRLKAHAFAGPVLYQFPLLEGQNRKVLAEAKVIQLLFPQEWEYEDPDYKTEYAGEVVNNLTKLEAVRRIVRYLTGHGRYCMTLAWSRIHVKAVSDALDEPHRVVMGGIPSDVRRKARKRLEDGTIRVLVSSHVSKKGTNIKRVDAMIDMAEMKSQNDAQQKLGRGVRLHPDKTELLYVDIGTSTGRFAKAARSRASALRALGVPFERYEVRDAKEALTVLKSHLAAR